MKDRVLAKGEQVPKTAKGEAPQEESKGGGFFSGLMKIVGVRLTGQFLIRIDLKKEK